MQPGMLALSHREAASLDISHVQASLGQAGVGGAEITDQRGLLIATWGGLAMDRHGSLLLSKNPRRRDQDLETDALADLLERGDTAALREVVPPFAAFRHLPDGMAVAVTDALGFRHLYTTEGPGWAAVSTSARVLALVGESPLNRDSLALQSLLGWQVGQSTLFEKIEKLGPGELVRLKDGHLHVSGGPEEDPRPLELEEAVESAAAVLSSYLTAYMTDHPMATLQLTGGQDSRLLLSAVPKDLRSGLTAMTLAVAGSQDARIAGEITAKLGLRHHVEELVGLEAISPDDALASCLAASRSLEGMADPVALAGLSVAERRFEQGYRIAGLGGEVARGFYYLGRSRNSSVTRAKVVRLANWRMFANESIDPDALSAEVRDGAHEIAIERIHGLLVGTGKTWLQATDEFYLYQRMQRWAGVTDTAVCLERSVVNPMLDDRFISIARAMAPESKRNSLFLGRLQMALDPCLGRMPLDNRPAPIAYANPGIVNRARATGTLAHKAASKVRQRLTSSTRPPAGGATLAGKVVEAWRRDPSYLEDAAAHSILNESWLEQMVSGQVHPAPSTVAFILNVSALPRTR